MYTNLKNLIKKPSPWIWFGKDFYFKRLGKSGNCRFFLELIQQLNWWFHKTFQKQIFLSKIASKNTLFMACILNSYKLSEVILWKNYGIETWLDLSEKISLNQSGYFLDSNRKNWPGKCKKAIKILSDKFETYKYVLDEVKPKYTLISSKKIICENHSWFKKSLTTDGIVLKPRIGSSSQNIYIFKYFNNKLLIKKIFNDKNKIEIFSKNIPSIEYLYSFWRKLTKSQEDAICIKYYKSTKEFPELCESIVLRVITEKNRFDSSITIKWVWAELPYRNEEFVFVNLKGPAFCINKRGELIIKKQRYNKLNHFINKIRKGDTKVVQDCLDLALKLHENFPTIDMVAWDFIPTETSIILLEGNTHFEYLLPQVINHLIFNVYNLKE